MYRHMINVDFTCIYKQFRKIEQKRTCYLTCKRRSYSFHYLPNQIGYNSEIPNLGDEKETSGLRLDPRRRRQNPQRGRRLLARRRWGLMILLILGQKSVCRGLNGFLQRVKCPVAEDQFSCRNSPLTCFHMPKRVILYFHFPSISYFSEINRCADSKSHG